MSRKEPQMGIGPQGVMGIKPQGVMGMVMCRQLAKVGCPQRVVSSTAVVSSNVVSSIIDMWRRTLTVIRTDGQFALRTKFIDSQ